MKFSKAAQRLRVAQPSLSRQIQQLEEGIGAKLFARTPRGALLTPAGRTFLKYAKAMLRMRKQAIEHTNRIGSGGQLPFRFGFSPWIEQELVQEVFSEYRESMPTGVLETMSNGSATLTKMVLEGALGAALVHRPVGDSKLFVQTVCTEQLMLCMRADDPLCDAAAISRGVVEDRLRIMFARDLHPGLYDLIERKLAKAHIQLKPREFVLHPADSQFLVGQHNGWSLMQEHASIQPGLVLRAIDGISLTARTALVGLPVLEHPILPMLAYRLAKHCIARASERPEKKTVSRVPHPAIKQARLFG